MFNKSPEMPFCFSLKITPSCQTLSKALDMSKKTLLTSSSSSKDLLISWVIDWLMLIDTGITRFETGLVCWNQVIIKKKSKHFVKNKSSEDFATNREQGNWTIGLFKVCLSPFLWIGTMLAFFQSHGKEPETNASLNISCKGSQMASPHINANA